MNELFNEYRNQLMVLLSNQATRRSHRNILMHIQAYFTRYITPGQRNSLSKLILDYRRVIQPVLATLTLLSHYSTEYHDNYLYSQRYFQSYPKSLKLRYGI